jgi:hypothetical protein
MVNSVRELECPIEILLLAIHNLSEIHDLVLKIAKDAKGSDTEGYNTEFVKLVETCKLIDNRKER